MPILIVNTNDSPAPEKINKFITKASSVVAEALGKPESYVTVFVNTNSNYANCITVASFGGSQDPCAIVELQSIGSFSDAAKTNQLAASLTNVIHQELGIPKNRFYIRFTELKASHVAFNGQTFG